MFTSHRPPCIRSGIARFWRPVGRSAALVIWGLWAMGMAAVTASAAPAAGNLSCGAAGAQPSRATALNAGGALITLNSSQGSGGTKLLVHGTGWPAQAQIQVDEESNGQALPGNFGVAAMAAADGTFDAPAFAAAVPTCGFNPSPGLVVQIVARTADKQVSAVAPFTYVDPPTLAFATTAYSVSASAPSVPVQGANWDAGTAVTLWAAPELPSINSQDPWRPPAGAATSLAQADAQGNVAVDVPLPTGLRPGTWIVVGAVSTSDRYGELYRTLTPIELLPPVAPALKLDRVQGLAGARVAISGTGYWSGDTVTIEYCRGAPHLSKAPIVLCNEYVSQVLGQATVDPAGHFAARVELPRTARTGLITFEAYATDPAIAMIDPYTLTVPFHVVAPAPAGWQGFATVHPRAAGVLTALAFGAPVVLGLLGLAGAAWWIATRRGRGLRPR